MAELSRSLAAVVVATSIALATAAPAGAANAGDLDPTFGSGGIATTPAGDAGDAQGNALLRRADGSLVLAGTAVDASAGKLALARYSDAGALAGVTLTGVFPDPSANARAAHGGGRG